MVLRVKLEIVPFGEEEKAREIGRLDIFNKGPINDACQYGVIEMTPTSGGLHNDTIIHFRSDGAWELVRHAIEGLDIRGPK